MTPHDKSNHWLVLDWIDGVGHSWSRNGGEDAERFLLITRDKIAWIGDAVHLSLPEDGFVLVTFLDRDEGPLGEEDLQVDRLLNPGVGELRVWCHYGGPIELKRVRDRWRSFTDLTQSLRDKLTERLPPLYPHPVPISDSHPLPWNAAWQEIRDIILSYEPAKWDELREKLDRTWVAATGRLRDEAAIAARSDWAGVAQAVENLQPLLPAEGGEPNAEQLSAFLRAANSSQLDQLRLSATGAGELDAALAKSFKAALDAIGALSADPGRDAPDQVGKYVELIRTSLRDFLSSYDA